MMLGARLVEGLKGAEVRYELRHVEPLNLSAKGNPLIDLHVELMTEETQHDTSAGLRFVVSFKNVGSEGIQIRYPDDMVQLNLLNEEGKPVRFPTHAPSALVNTRERNAIRPNAPRLLKIEPGQEHRTTQTVREMRNDKSPTTTPLPPGRYTAQIRVLLLTANPKLEHEQSYRVLESPPVSVDFGK